jgi:hypothetical protein
MPSLYAAKCSYGESGPFLEQKGNSLPFRGDTVTIEAEATLSHSGDDTSWVRLKVLRFGEPPGPDASQEVINTILAWYNAGRFEEH